MASTLYSIGHSTHSIGRFLELLTQHSIELLVDVRRFPGSRKFPHFGREALQRSLVEAGIDYRWMEALGGRRRKLAVDAAENLGLRNASFRNYADYMATDEFRAGIESALNEANGKRAAFMCSESLYWRCHRRLISDYLLASGLPVQHIMPTGELRTHTLTSGATTTDGQVRYPPPASQQGMLPL